MRRGRNGGPIRFSTWRRWNSSGFYGPRQRTATRSTTMFGESFIGMTLNEAKSRFFDRAAVLTQLDKAEKKVFNRVGAKTRQYARRSMKAASKRKLKQISEMRRELLRITSRRRLTQAAVTRAAALTGELHALEKSVHSQPGEAPKTVKGTIKRMLLYSLGETNKTVVVGPILFEPRTGAPEDLEYGLKFAARPFMGPAKKWVEPQITPMFRDAM